MTGTTRCCCTERVLMLVLAASPWTPGIAHGQAGPPPTEDPAPADTAPAAGDAEPERTTLEAEQRALERADAEERAAEQEPPGENPAAWSKFFYLQGTFGYSYVDLRALAFDGLTPDEFTVNGSGYTTGAALGFRLFLLNLGARVAWARHDQFALGAVMGEIGLRVPNDIAEPYLRVGAGYGWMNEDFDQLRAEARQDPQIDGFMAEVGTGFDFWVHELVTVGLAIDIAFYLLARDAIEACIGGGCPSFEDAGEEGDATAIQARVALQVGLVL